MSEHQITNLLNISLDNLKEMVKAEMVMGEVRNVGEAYVIPIAKVKCSFVSGGMDQKMNKSEDTDEYPFGGATGGTITITPIAVLSCEKETVKVLHLADDTHILEKTIENISSLIQSLIDKINKKNEPQVYQIEKE